MKYRSVGKSGLKISEVALGSWVTDLKGSSERSTAPGIEARIRSNCRKQPLCVAPARQRASVPSSTETGLMSRPTVLSGPWSQQAGRVDRRRRSVCRLAGP